MMIKMKMHCFELESVKQVTDTVQSHPSLFIRANIDSDEEDDDEHNDSMCESSD